MKCMLRSTTASGLSERAGHSTMRSSSRAGTIPCTCSRGRVNLRVRPRARTRVLQSLLPLHLQTLQQWFLLAAKVEQVENQGHQISQSALFAVQKIMIIVHVLNVMIRVLLQHQPPREPISLLEDPFSWWNQLRESQKLKALTSERS